MGIPPLGSAASTSAVNAVKASSQEATASPSFAEIAKLAVSPGDTVTLSAQAKALMQNQGAASALALLGN